MNRFSLEPSTSFGAFEVQIGSTLQLQDVNEPEPKDAEIFFNVFYVNIHSLFMKELQQLNLAPKLPGQKMHVIVSLFSMPKVMYSLGYDDDFWEAKEQWECPCDERPFWVRDTSLRSTAAWAEETQKV